MREQALRRALAVRLGARSVESYVAYCRRVERELGVDLDQCDLTEAGVAEIAARLRTLAVAENSIANCLSALRAYGQLDSSPAEGARAPRMTITREQRMAWRENTSASAFNSWLDARVRDDAGRLDLDRLHALAERYGIEKRADYAGLNPGQQRMNIGNLLRSRVPASGYDAEGELAPAADVPAALGDGELSPAPDIELERVEVPQPRAEVRDSSIADLLSLYGEIMDELRERGVVRTGNAPVGDYAELLFSRAFGWTLEANSAAGFDATDGAGVRYQIKGRRVRSLAASRQLSAIRRLNDRTFDVLAAVLFDTSFKVIRAVLIPHEVVVRRARRVEHTNSWTFILDDKVWRDPGVRDATAEIAVAASKV